jgi:hypothetical protein
MKEQPGGVDTHDSANQPDPGFILDPRRGLYVPESESGADTGEHHKCGRSPKTPLHVSVGRDWVVVAISVLTLLGVAGTVYFTGAQWKETRRSATAAENAVAKAQKAIDAARDNFRQDQRPYLGIDPVRRIEAPDRETNGPQKGHLRATINFVNFGKSPAVRIGSDAHLVFGDQATTMTRIPWSDTKEHGGITEPTEPQFIYAYSDERISDESLLALKHGRLPWMLFGHFEYGDIFGEPPLTYITEFCVGFPAGLSLAQAERIFGACRDHTAIYTRPLSAGTRR